jgi:hypothetical protein
MPLVDLFSSRTANAVRKVFGRCVPASKVELLERTLLAVFLCVFFYGFVMYPDAPIKPCGEAAYCGRGGTLRSEAEFRAFRRWEVTFVVTVMIVIPSGFFLSRYKKKKGS